MKKSLLDQKENAFLSKSLATIITDLDVVYAPSESLVSLLQKEAYIALLQEYEFRSLVPKTQTDKRLEVPVIPLLSDESYYAFLAQITKHQYPLALRVDSSHVLWIATPDSVYSLDTKQIDASEFVDMCLSHRIPLIAYQMKLLWHQLVSIRRQTSRENRDIQASLF